MYNQPNVRIIINRHCLFEFGKRWRRRKAAVVIPHEPKQVSFEFGMKGRKSNVRVPINIGQQFHTIAIHILESYMKVKFPDRQHSNNKVRDPYTSHEKARFYILYH